MSNLEYWEEAASHALDDARITATKEQVNTVAASIMASHECHEMLYRSGPPDAARVDPKDEEIKRLKGELETERYGKARCEHCQGHGSYKDMWGREFGCDGCKGTGKVKR